MPIPLREKRDEKDTLRQCTRRRNIYAAGNSIAVNVLMALFGEMFGIPWQEKVFKERMKTEEELLSELPLFEWMRENTA